MHFDYGNDIHLDFWVPFDLNQLKFERKTRAFAGKLIPESSSGILVLGGDLGHYNHQVKWFLDELSKYYEKVLFVVGNHDYYLVSDSQSKKYRKNSVNRINELRDYSKKHPKVIFLEGTTFEYEGVTFGGTGMWYDFQYGKKRFGKTIEEVRLEWAQNSKDFKKISGILTIDHFEDEARRLRSIIGQCDVIVTHVGPDWSFSPQRQKQHIHDSYYFFDGREFLKECEGKTWCFGHVHIEVDEVKGGARLISHGLGYPDESKFKHFKTINIKQNNT